MKFTLDAGGAQAAGQGIGNMFKAYALGPMYRQQAEQESMGSAAKIAQAQAVARKYNADADLDINKLRLQQDPLQSAMLEHGLPTNLAPAFKSRLETGSFGPSYEAPADGVGPTQPAPANEATLAKLGQSMALMQRMYGSGSNVEQGAKAGAIEQQQRNIAAIQANPALAGATGQAYAATEGKDLFSAVQDTGASINKFTGAQEIVNRVLDGRHGAESGAKVAQSRAAAANSNAAAGQHSAQTQKIRQDIEMGGKGVIQQTDQGLMLVDPRAGTARPITGAGGAPLAGKPKDMTEGQAKANLFGGRMSEANAVIGGLADKGVTRPGNIKQTAESVVGIVPFVGDKLADAAGTATNWTQSAGQQQIDQAQRDFINAVLRRESGAAIADSEFANAKKQYFPAVGDSKEVLAQKSNNRNLATKLMLSEVPEGRRYKPQDPPKKADDGRTGEWEDATAPAASGGWSIKRID